MFLENLSRNELSCGKDRRISNYFSQQHQCCHSGLACPPSFWRDPESRVSCENKNNFLLDSRFRENDRIRKLFGKTTENYQVNKLGFKLGTPPPKISASVTSALFEDILNRGLTLRVKVTGRSMAPFLTGGEVLTIKRVHYASLRKGDLIFFRNPEGFPVLHRLIKKKKIQNNMFTFQTKGDSLMSFDEPVHETGVFGKVCTIEKIISNGKTKSIDMEAFLWRTINLLIVLGSIFKSKAYFTTRRIYRIKHLSFMKP